MALKEIGCMWIGFVSREVPVIARVNAVNKFRITGIEKRYQKQSDGISKNKKYVGNKWNEYIEDDGRVNDGHTVREHSILYSV